jgi:hypothetical protein
VRLLVPILPNLVYLNLDIDSHKTFLNTQKVKTISWEQGIGGIGNSMHDGELENLWGNEKHDTTHLFQYNYHEDT